MNLSTTAGTLIDTTRLDWIPLEAGQSFKPISLPDVGPRQLLLRVDPGSVVGRHRHHGDVHSYTMEGTRMLLDPAGHVEVTAGTYVFEPAGTVDSWMAVGDRPCVVHVSIAGSMDSLDPHGHVVGTTDTAELRRIYLDWCDTHDIEPDPTLAGARC